MNLGICAHIESGKLVNLGDISTIIKATPWTVHCLFAVQNLIDTVLIFSLFRVKDIPVSTL